MKHYRQSSTILGAIKAQKQTALSAPIGGAIALGTEILISEIGASEPINEAIRHIANGAVNGEDIASIAINAGIILSMGALANAVGKKTAKETIEGRLNASEKIDRASLPREYKLY